MVLACRPQDNEKHDLTASGYTCLYLVTRQEGVYGVYGFLLAESGGLSLSFRSCVSRGGALKLCLPCLRLLFEWMV